MATILELVARGDLVKLDPQLDPDEQEFRLVYFVRKVSVGLDAQLEQMQSLKNIEQSPAEQLDDILYNFTSGKPLGYPRDFHEMRHRGDGFWELRTADVRVFGFFPRKDHFVCTDVADKNRLVEFRLTNQYIEQGKRRRAELDLDQPGWIESLEPRDVVSDWYHAE